MPLDLPVGAAALRFSHHPLAPSQEWSFAIRRDETASQPTPIGRCSIHPPSRPPANSCFFGAERGWRQLVGALLPPPPPVQALLSDFARYTTEHGWTTDTAETMACLLRIAATWMGTDAPYREEDLRALNCAYGNTVAPGA